MSRATSTLISWVTVPWNKREVEYCDIGTVHHDQQWSRETRIVSQCDSTGNYPEKNKKKLNILTPPLSTTLARPDILGWCSWNEITTKSSTHKHTHGVTNIDKIILKYCKAELTIFFFQISWRNNVYRNQREMLLQLGNFLPVSL